MDTQYKVEVFKGKDVTKRFIRLDEIVGKGILVSDGWEFCSNPKYLTRNGDTIYFNSIMRVWLFI